MEMRTTMTQNFVPQVFLGGSCNPTTWRFDVAMPTLERAGVAYYNPQVTDWHKGLMALEAVAKAESSVLLFVIDGQTRAIASMLEAVEYITTGRKVVLVLQSIPDGTVIDGQTITGRELQDLNRARAYLGDIAARYDNTQVCATVDGAVSFAASAV